MPADPGPWESLASDADEVARRVRGRLDQLLARTPRTADERAEIHRLRELLVKVAEMRHEFEGRP